MEPAPTRDDTRAPDLPDCKNQPRTPAIKPRPPPATESRKIRANEPDVDDWVGEFPPGHRRPRGYVQLEDGTVVKGQRILLVKRYADGQYDMVIVDG